jgi:hypothetical protein
MVIWRERGRFYISAGRIPRAVVLISYRLAPIATMIEIGMRKSVKCR